MTSKKDRDMKEFLITQRKKVKPGLTGAPVWVMQKSGKRIWIYPKMSPWQFTYVAAPKNK